MLSGVEKYLQQAEEALKTGSLDDFSRYIGNAESVASDEGTLARVLFLRAKGLSVFRRFQSAIKAIDEALQVSQSERDRVRLLKGKANIYTYTGKFRDSLRVLKEIMTQTSDEYLLSEIYLSMAGTYLMFYKAEPSDSILDEAKFYLDEAYKAIEQYDNNYKKRLVFKNYGEYFKLKRDYDMSIEMLEESLKYCEESQLSELYVDLVQLYLERNAEGDLETLKKYLHDSELIASKFENEFDMARTFYMVAKIVEISGDYIKSLDYLHIACNNFLDIEAYSNAFECYKELVRVSGLLNNDFVSSVRERISRQFEETGYKQLL